MLLLILAMGKLDFLNLTVQIRFCLNKFSLKQNIIHPVEPTHDKRGLIKVSTILRFEGGFSKRFVGHYGAGYFTLILLIDHSSKINSNKIS